MNGRPRSPASRGGFVLVLVVMMLFAISVASATGYIVVNNEFEMAKYSDEAAEALSVARAGLHRFVAEQLGVVGNDVTYASGTGVATITTRKLGVIDSDTDLYYVRSEGAVTNIFTPSSPARRVVGAYAYHHRRPLPVTDLAALVVTSASAGAGSNGTNGIVSGNDHNDNSDCSAASGPSDIAGVIARNSTISSGTLDGSPPGRTLGSYSNIYNEVALRWDVLTHPSFPVDFVNVEPNWASIPSDSFPVIRITTSSFSPNDSWDGRGVLIVTGELNARTGWDWDGIVLAGAMEDDQEAQIRGMVIGGLNAQNPDDVVFDEGGWVRYYSCTVWDANESLSYMELLSDTEWEIS